MSLVVNQVVIMHMLPGFGFPDNIVGGIVRYVQPPADGGITIYVVNVFKKPGLWPSPVAGVVEFFATEGTGINQIQAAVPAP